MILADRANAVSPSPTLAIDAKVKRLKAGGVDIVGFGVGEPDFDTPEPIKEAAINALSQGFTKYTPSAGIPELRNAVCQRLLKEYGLQYGQEQVVISCGAKHSLYNTFQAICGPGDEVLVLTPFWVSYPEIIKLAGATPVFVETRASEGFKPDPELISRAITPRTKAIIVNSPSNPTGAVFSREDMVSIAALAVERNLTIVSDEIYDRLVYGVGFTSMASLGDEVRARTVLINGMSKTYSMTGWRIGYAVGDPGLIAAMADIQSHSTSNPASISQYAALAALTDPRVEEQVALMIREFGRRRDILVEGLNGIRGFECPIPQGAFYAFPDVSELYGSVHGDRMIDGSDTLADLLLTVAKVGVIPGSGFGSEGHIRLSYATSMDNILEGLKRIGEFVNGLSR